MAENDDRIEDTEPEGPGLDDAPADEAEGPNAEDTAAIPTAKAKETGRAILRATGKGAVWTGRLLARFGIATSEAAVAAYNAVDPDVRRHAAHAPLVGLTHLLPTPPIAALPDDGHRPVLFVHGLAGHPGNFAGMRTFFRISSRTRTYAIVLPGGDRIPAQATALANALKEICRANSLPETAQVDIVAHSMGGLVSRLMLDDADLRARVHTLVTLGTPHTGTWAARYASTEQTMDLRPTSEAMRTLAEQTPWASEGWPRLVNFWSESDMLLLPPSVAVVDGASGVVECPGASHMSYLLDPRIFAKVFEALR
jgi:pimeloyl-ACP methyl ester carboxylesterase